MKWQRNISLISIGALCLIIALIAQREETPNQTTASQQQGNLIRVITDPNEGVGRGETKEEGGEEKFEASIPVVWAAKVLGCLMSCAGYSFENLDSEAEYPYFQGYDNLLDEENLSLYGRTFKVSGLWTGIDCAYQDTVFGGECTPSVQITAMKEFPKQDTDWFSEELVRVGGADYMFSEWRSAGNAGANIEFALWDLGSGSKTHSFYSEYNFRRDEFYTHDCDSPQYSEGADNGVVGTFLKERIVEFWRKSNWPKRCLGI